MSTKGIFNKFNAIKGASFISINGYKNSHGEISNQVLNIGVSIRNAQNKDMISLSSMNDQDYLNLAKETSIDETILRKACNEMVESLVKNTSENLDEHTSQSQVNANNYIQLTDGLKMNKNSMDVMVYGFVNSKKIIQEGIYKQAKSQPKTMAKRAIEKYLDLRMPKYRQYILGNAENIKITGTTFQLD